MSGRPRLCLPLVLTIMVWGMNFVALKIAYRELSPEALSVLRLFVMWGFLAGYCKLRGISLKSDPKDFWRINYFGFVAMGVYMAIFLGGVHGTSPSEAAVMIALAPLFTSIGAVMLRHEPFRWEITFGAAIAFIGVAIVMSGGQSQNHLIGNLAVALAALIWAHATLLMRPLLRKYPPTALLTMAMPGGLPVILLFGLRATLQVHYFELHPATVLAFLVVALGSGVIGFVNFYKGVKHIGATRAVNYQFFTPIVTAFLSSVILSQRPTLQQFAGLLVVIGGLSFAQTGRRQAAPFDSESAFPGTIEQELSA